MRDSNHGPISEIVAPPDGPVAEHVPEHGRLIGLVVEADILGALDQRVLRPADDGDAG